MSDIERSAQWSVVMAALRRPCPPQNPRPAPAAALDRGSYLCNQSVTYFYSAWRIMSRIRAKTDAFRAIADPTRRAILDRLRAGPANAGTLAADFRSSRPAVSKHLRVLREARLVVDTKIGRERLYAVNPVPLQSVAGWLEGYRAFWQASLMRLKRNLEEK
jgi:DNA-binding transcriptional ArsR family regulator